MPNESSKEIQARIDALPSEIKAMVYSESMNKIIQQIGAKNQLHVDQIGALESEVVAAMIGITPLVELAANISDALDIDNVKSDAIVKDVNEQLLEKVRSTMKKTDERSATPTPAIINPPAVHTAPITEKSVIMPSAAKAPVPAVTPSMPLIPPVVKPAALDAMQHVDAMLSAPTVSMAPKPGTAPTPATPAVTTPTSASTPTPDVKKSDVPAPPPIYKTDPYHEPI